MKPDSLEQYRADSADLAQRALLTTWDCLAAYREDLVLVGGLAVRYLTRRAPEGLPDAVTFDVDFGISIGSSGGIYGSIRQTLASHDFEWRGGRFAREFEGVTIFLDLLTDDGRAQTGYVVVDDSLSVGIVPGVERALEKFRVVEIAGRTLLGVEQMEYVRIAEVGPMLVLKLNAFGGPTVRKAPKDAHDITYLGLNYLGGLGEAVSGFAAEKAAGNRGVASALRALREYFHDENAQGPVSCAAFRLNNQHMLPENEIASLRIRQSCVSLTRELLG